MRGSGATAWGKKRNVPSADRLAVAKLLAGCGPLYGDAAAARLGWEADRWWAVVGAADGWFALTGKGWVLSEAGWEAAEVEV